MELSRVDVPELLRRLGLRAVRRGREWWACCPVHEEREPSWHMRHDPGAARHGMHACHGCGWGGGPVALVRQVLGCGGQQARRWLEQGQVVVPALGVRLVCSDPGGFRLPSTVHFQRWPQPASEYLERRGVGQAIRDRWRVGWAAAGRLAGRVVLVAWDQRGRPCGYAARSFVGAEPRYLYPRQVERPRPCMFGELHWPAVPDRRVVVVVEGALDGLAVDGACGVPIAAVGGSALQPWQAGRLATFPRVVVGVDPDRAGAQLARAIRSALGRHVEVVEARPPEGWDWSALAERRGQAAVRQELALVGLGR